LEIATNNNYYTQAGELETAQKIRDYGLTIQSATDEDVAAMKEVSLRILREKYAPASEWAGKIVESAFAYVGQ